MDTKIKNYLGLASIIGMIGLLVAAWWHVGIYSRSVMPASTFSASGEGRVSVVPDVALVNVGVLTQGGTNLSALQQENTDKVNRITDFLKTEQQIKARDIKTQNYSITPRYRSFACPAVAWGGGSNPCPPAEIVGYDIQQNLEIKIRDLGRIGAVLKEVVGLGANTVYGPSFVVDDPAEFLNRAREEAIAEAQAAARAIAAAGHFRLGRLVSLYEQNGQPKIYAAEAFGRGGDVVMPPTPTIEPGSQEIEVSVVLTYQIK